MLNQYIEFQLYKYWHVSKTRQEGFKITDKNNYDAIIIGAGMGGLNSGIYLQSKNTNLRTIILEKNSYPGGYSSGPALPRPKSHRR